jgi:Gram-negative bacterial TonB protein C-terminal
MKCASNNLAVTFIAAVGLFCFSGILAGAAGNPEFRPALIGNGPKSLVNLIDVQKLLQERQADGLVMFTAFPSGDRLFKGSAAVYSGTPGTTLLEKEVRRALDKAVMTPALADHKPVLVVFDGTVMFFRDTTPHLRVLANQDPSELAHFNDFIAPQLIFTSNHWDPKTTELDAARRLGKNGVVVLSLHVDQHGRLLDSKLVSESPPGFNFGPLMLKSFGTAKFIPAFRNGKPVECTFRRTEYVQVRP